VTDPRHGVPGVDKGGNVRNLGYVSTETIANQGLRLQGAVQGSGMPEFTGKLTEADVLKSRPSFRARPTR
jgi:quinohemoprotein ethanol dehydrogenase